MGNRARVRLQTPFHRHPLIPDISARRLRSALGGSRWGFGSRRMASVGIWRSGGWRRSLRRGRCWNLDRGRCRLDGRRGRRRCRQGWARRRCCRLRRRGDVFGRHRDRFRHVAILPAAGTQNRIRFLAGRQRQHQTHHSNDHPHGIPPRWYPAASKLPAPPGANPHARNRRISSSWGSSAPPAATSMHSAVIAARVTPRCWWPKAYNTRVCGTVPMAGT